jgi:hypothetical protein
LHLNRDPGKWSIHDNVAHLAKYQPVFLERIESMLSRENPVFERYSAESDPEFEIWRRKETNSLVELLNRDRITICNRIHTIKDSELSFTGTHKKFGTITILDWTELFLLHESHHIFTIFKLAHNE